MKIKILEFHAYQGNKCKVYSHNFRKGKWKENPKFDFYKRLIDRHPVRFLEHKEYEREVKSKDEK